jgi:pimeloyl-ACP methyl ester carboxylesterase
MAPVARRLSTWCGVVEPFQRKDSIQEEILELNAIIEKETKPPVILIGYSYGAWLGCLFAAAFPPLVRKLILVSCPPFDERDSATIMKTRLERLSASDRAEFNALQQQLHSPESGNTNVFFARLGTLFQKVDSYDPLLSEIEEIEPDFRIYEKIWAEAKELRRSGALIRSLNTISCPVTAFHGEWDPHPVQGAFTSLSLKIAECTGIIMKECGHTPWIERKARDQFFSLLKHEIQAVHSRYDARS